jgi:hypothetical protein
MVLGAVDELLLLRREEVDEAVLAGDDEAVSAGLVRLFLDRTAAQSYGREGHIRASTIFSEEEMHAAYASLYNSMIGSRALVAPQ